LILIIGSLLTTKSTFSLNANYPASKRAKRFTTIARYQTLAAVVLLSVSGGLAGKPSQADTQATLSKVAYIQFACVFVSLVVVVFALFRKISAKNGDRLVGSTLPYSV
jgi:uncharacterized membrane protein